MFQTTRRRLALWYTTVTAILLLIFASGVYFYVRNTLVERVDDTLNHVVEVVQRSLVIEAAAPSTGRVLTAAGVKGRPPLQVNVEDSFRDNAQTLEDDHIDIEWFDPSGRLQWSTLSVPSNLPLQVNAAGETVHLRHGANYPQAGQENQDQVLRQISRRIQVNNQVLGYLRVSHPWFEVSKPSRQLVIDLSIWSGLVIVVTGTIGWLLSGLAMAPVRQSYQQLKQFTADASHELRNPIAVIQTNVQVALADPDADFQHSQLQVVERLTRRLGRLVDNLLFLARQDGGLIPMQWEELNLQKLLLEVVEEQELVAQSQGLTLMYNPDQLDAQTPLLTGDRDQLIRLFTNLISNAIQYTPAGTVTITLDTTHWQNQKAYRVAVCDTGIGIDKELQPQVFDRFYRVDKARSRREGTGSGLGLAIAKAIITNHQGQIQLDSQPGKGTTITTTLPCNIKPHSAIPGPTE
ncbi:integral membrane sensor signal transduction histidine kinase [Leptolyngbya sp. Heron Island J]|uniref:sensor histidine kinase n=1 Tax=Leptolyngbya sp. Heron Island J TaxID=1385935 RepID=UPI0003B966F7|nr:HAMP domain-containing sensor histidine kinase [Leptolyngbya sp. Heron Island J]ESA36941.1 integral membrane sensor signal transduction histidine kinase [Leptolyngbya sp. Heron Island J]